MAAVTRVRISILVAVLAGCFAVPAVASADCTLPTASANDLLGGTTQTFSGNFGPELNGKFIQVPFDVGAGVTGMRIRYCYKNAGADPSPYPASTLDLAAYEPNSAQPENYTMAQRRGWSGSAVKVIGIGENGPTSTAVYNSGRKAYVPGNTTRAYEPGPVPDGKWAVELGAGYIDPDLAAGVDWKVEVVTSKDAAWSDQGFIPQPYQPYVANPAAGWYTGDLHVHGENEPGNAPMTDSFDLGFDTRGLDFMTLVDHNNDVARTNELGEYRPLYPGKLIIPGTEMTTYDGHFNSQNSNIFTDFRLSDIYRWDDSTNTGTPGVLDEGELTHVRGPENPSARFAQIQSAGGWSQINHPASAKDNPAACRGCAWTYSDARTDFSKVDAIEIATGPTGLLAENPTVQIPFTDEAIVYYEHALDTGAHIAAVSSSDDHKAEEFPTGSQTSLGRGSTVVHADELSQSGITAGVKAGHTYAKPFGPRTPDVEMTATGSAEQSGTAIPGDSLTSDKLNLSINVKNAGPSAYAPGPYTLEILKDGVSVDSTAVTGDDFTYDNYSTTDSGRYSFKLVRMVGANPLIEAYSTPVWFTYKSLPPVPTCETDPSLCPKPSNNFKFKGVKLNKKKGTARLRVWFASPGRASLNAPGIKKVKVKVKKNGQTIGLNIKPKGKLKKKLRKRGHVRVRNRIYYKPTGGKARTRPKVVKLVLKKKSRKKHRR